MNLRITEKISLQPQERRAYVYIRQSTQTQVRHHRTSQDNQYALVERAQALGWPRERIYVIDEDLGQSGQDSTRKQGFWPPDLSTKARQRQTDVLSSPVAHLYPGRWESPEPERSTNWWPAPLVGERERGMILYERCVPHVGNALLGPYTFITSRCLEP